MLNADKKFIIGSLFVAFIAVAMAYYGNKGTEVHSNLYMNPDLPAMPR